MKYLVSLITDETADAKPASSEAEGVAAEMERFMDELQSSGSLDDWGAKLGPSAEARTLRYGDEGRAVVTDGPFAESKEQLAGYMVLDCSSLDEAMEWAERMPLRHGAIEVRPIAAKPDND